MKIRFDTDDAQQPRSFDHPVRVIYAATPSALPNALISLDAALSEGHWIAGYASYEMGYALEPRLNAAMPETRQWPLLCFGVYKGPTARPPLSTAAHRAAQLSAFTPQWRFDDYEKAFTTVQRYIAAGDIYQANLTFGLTAELQGSVERLFDDLSAYQAVKHGALVEQEDGRAIISRSPELFFRTDASGQIETRPMKGTQPRGITKPEDQKRLNYLQSDPKNRAENLMIVDLLRNDISRICEAGSVKVPSLYRVETYATVHQMTSQVLGHLRRGQTLSDIFKALFPCGSITGAPKLRAMQILRDLEPEPREIYCGTIGWAAPDGSSEFNVAIRSLMIDNQSVRLNVGGGVVYDSDAASEYEEALWKARFATTFQKTAD